MKYRDFIAALEKPVYDERARGPGAADYECFQDLASAAGCVRAEVPELAQKSQVSPMAAATSEASSMPSFASSTKLASRNASCVMKSDIVNPMPASHAAPASCVQVT